MLDGSCMGKLGRNSEDIIVCGEEGLDRGMKKCEC